MYKLDIAIEELRYALSTGNPDYIKNAIRFIKESKTSCEQDLKYRENQVILLTRQIKEST